MSGKRQKIRTTGLGSNGRGGTPAGGHPRAEPFVAKPAPESPAVTEQLMEEVCDGKISKVRGNAFEGTRAVLAWMG